MASALNDAKSAWDECLHKNCKKCLDQYNGRKFAAVRRTIVNGSERTAKLGQEIFFPRLDDLKKLNSLFDVPMVDYKHVRIIQICNCVLCFFHKQMYVHQKHLTVL